MNAVATAVAAAFRAQKIVAGIDVTLLRGDFSTPGVRVVPGKSVATVEETDGSFTRIHSRDFLVRVDEYVFGDRAVEPWIGDRIVEDADDARRVFEVRPFGGDGAARHLDNARTAWRIHTKLIAVLYDNQLTTDEGVGLTSDLGEPLLAE